MCDKKSVLLSALLVLAVVSAAGHRVIVSGITKSGLIWLAIVAAGGLLLGAGLLLRSRLFGVWLTFVSSIVVVTGAIGNGAFQVANFIGWVTIGATGLIAVITVMEWAESAESRRPTRNF